MDMRKLSELMRICCRHFPPSSPVLYALRRLFPNDTEFSLYRVHHKLRTPFSFETRVIVLNTTQKIADDLLLNAYNQRYYLRLLQDRIMNLQY